jgi:hypothetical protein
MAFGFRQALGIDDALPVFVRKARCANVNHKIRLQLDSYCGAAETAYHG